MLDLEYLKTLPPEQAQEYLRQMLAAGIDPNNLEASGIGAYKSETFLPGINTFQDPYAATYTALLPSGTDRDYLAHFDKDGKLAAVGRQPEDSWQDRQVFGVPLGFLATLAAPVAAAYLGPTAVGADAGSIALTDAELAAMGIGGAAEPVTAVGATLGETGLSAGAAGSGIGGGALGTGLTPGVSSAGIGGGALGTGIGAAGAASSSGWVPAALEAVKQLATTKGGMTAAGALLGLLSSGDKQSTASKEPWGPAQPLLKDLIQSGQNLKNFYSANPFNDQQMTGYSNLFSDLNSFRASMPGLLDFANRMSGATYSRDGGMTYGTNRMFAPVAGSSYGPVNFAQYKGLL